MRWALFLLTIFITLASCSRHERSRSTMRYTGTVYVTHEMHYMLGNSGSWSHHKSDSSYTETALVNDSEDTVAMVLPITQALFYTFRKPIWFTPNFKKNYMLSVASTPGHYDEVEEHFMIDDHSLTYSIYWLHGYIFANYTITKITFVGYS